jgi:serine/threonine protein kinase
MTQYITTRSIPPFSIFPLLRHMAQVVSCPRGPCLLVFVRLRHRCVGRGSHHGGAARLPSESDSLSFVPRERLQTSTRSHYDLHWQTSLRLRRSLSEVFDEVSVFHSLMSLILLIISPCYQTLPPDPFPLPLHHQQVAPSLSHSGLISFFLARTLFPTASSSALSLMNRSDHPLPHFVTLTRLLTVNPLDRISAEEARQHVYLKAYSQCASSPPPSFLLFSRWLMLFQRPTRIQF